MEKKKKKTEETQQPMRSWTLCALPIQQQHQDTRRGFMEMCQDQCASPQSGYHFIRLHPACSSF